MATSCQKKAAQYPWGQCSFCHSLGKTLQLLTCQALLKLVTLHPCQGTSPRQSLSSGREVSRGGCGLFPEGLRKFSKGEQHTEQPSGSDHIWAFLRITDHTGIRHMGTATIKSRIGVGHNVSSQLQVSHKQTLCSRHPQNALKRKELSNV